MAMKFMISFLAVILMPVTDIQAETLSVDEYAKAEKYIVEGDTRRLKSARQLSRMVTTHGSRKMAVQDVDAPVVGK